MTVNSMYGHECRCMMYMSKCMYVCVMYLLLITELLLCHATCKTA